AVGSMKSHGHTCAVAPLFSAAQSYICLNAGTPERQVLLRGEHMRPQRRQFLHLAAAAVGSLAAPATASAQAYPTRPIQVIVPYAGGSASDVVMRILLDRMGQSIGQPFIVDNRPGAGGNIGTAAATKAAPDGYTLVLGSTGPLASNKTLYRDLGY